MWGRSFSFSIELNSALKRFFAPSGKFLTNIMTRIAKPKPPIHWVKER